MVLLTLFLAFVLVGIPMLCVALPLIGIAKICEARKKYVDSLRNDQAAEQQPAVMVSKEDGRIIAMQAPDVQPVMQVDTSSTKPGKNVAADMAKKVAGKAAGAVAKHYLRRWLLGK